MQKKDPKKAVFAKFLAKAEVFLRPILFYRKGIRSLFLFALLLSCLSVIASLLFAGSLLLDFSSKTGDVAKPASRCEYDLCALGLEKDPFTRLKRRFAKDLVFLGPSLQEPQIFCFWSFLRKKVVVISQEQAQPLTLLIDLDEKLRSHLPANLLFQIQLLDEKSIDFSVLRKSPSGESEELAKWQMTQSFQEGVDPEFSEKLIEKARVSWFGEDLFLKHHASDEEKRLQRLDFLGSKPQSFYLSSDRFLVCGDDREWSLLHKASIDSEISVERFLQDSYYLELGEILQEGQQLELLLWPKGNYRKLRVVLDKKSEDASAKVPWGLNEIKKRIHLRGVRSKETALLQLDRTPMQLKLQDWFLLKEQGGWQKITHVQMVDDYVHGRLRGSLFIVTGIDAGEEGQVQRLHLRAFSPGRTMMEEFAIESLPIRHKKESSSNTPPSFYGNDLDEKSEKKDPSSGKRTDQDNSQDNQSSGDQQEGDDDFFYWRPEYEELDEGDIFEGENLFEQLPQLLREGPGQLTPEELLKMLKEGSRKEEPQEE